MELSGTKLLCLICRDRSRNTGYVACRVCLEDFQTSINCTFVDASQLNCLHIHYSSDISAVIRVVLDGIFHLLQSLDAVCMR